MARRRRSLTPEERDLWSRIARTATPLHPDRKKIDLPQDVKAPPARIAKVTDPVRHPPAVPLADFRVGQGVGSSASAPKPLPSPARHLSEAPLRMDPKIHRRMSQGKLRPEARLDLHGMTLAAAQPELMRFILSCHANGCRLVLVITGKGRGDHGPLPTRPGALRHQVPHWLHSPPLGRVVQQVKAAHLRHGGDGAYYVYLRKP